MVYDHINLTSPTRPITIHHPQSAETLLRFNTTGVGSWAQQIAMESGRQETQTLHLQAVF